MIRRTFLKWCSSAAVVALVTTQGFRPATAEGLPEHSEPVTQITRELSPVLQALNEWNDKRWKDHGGVLHEDGTRLIWDAERREFARMPNSIFEGSNVVYTPAQAKQAHAATLKAAQKTQSRVTRRGLIDSFFRES